jgi:hypothetical protein
MIKKEVCNMENAALAIDGHVHLYDGYDLREAVTKGIGNLIANTKQYMKDKSEIITIWFLVERADSNFFDQIWESPEKFNEGEITFDKGNDQLTIIAQKNKENVLYIFAGRQLVTREGLEVLSLISNLNIPDHQKTIDEVILDVKDSGGIPALNWAPGKWFFKRGKVIARQIEEKSPGDFFIGETTLRHTLWREPKLIKQARKKGFRIIAGSDPLPFKGEEKGIGNYGFILEGKFDFENPAQSLRDLLNHNEKDIRIIGKRNDVFTFARRQAKIMMEKQMRSRY